MVQFELHRWSLVIGFFKDLCMKIPSFYGTNEWNGKAEFHKIPRGMADKRRKYGIIPPKAEWLACLQHGPSSSKNDKRIRIS